MKKTKQITITKREDMEAALVEGAEAFVQALVYSGYTIQDLQKWLLESGQEMGVDLSSIVENGRSYLQGIENEISTE